QSRFGLSFQVAATIAKVIAPLTTAAAGKARASAAGAAQPIEEKASAKVARREEVWRRRNWVRLACTRNQSWIAVEDAAPRTTPAAVTAACSGATKARTASSGANTAPIEISTTSIL